MLHCIKQTRAVNPFFQFNLILPKIVGANGALFINHLKNMLEHRPKHISEDGKVWVHEPYKYWAKMLPGRFIGESISQGGFRNLINELKKMEIIYVTRKTSLNGDDYSCRNWYSLNFHLIEKLGKQSHPDFKYEYRPSSNLKIVVQKSGTLNASSLNNNINIINNNINNIMSPISNNDQKLNKIKDKTCQLETPSKDLSSETKNYHSKNERSRDFLKTSTKSLQTVHIDTNQDVERLDNCVEIAQKKKTKGKPGYKPKKIGESVNKTDQQISTYIKKGGATVLNLEITPEFTEFWNLYTEKLPEDLILKYQTWPSKKKKLHSMQYARSDKKRLAWRAWKRLKLDDEMQVVVLNKLRERNAAIRNWINNPDVNWMVSACNTLASTWLNNLEDSLEEVYPLNEVNENECNRNEPDWVRQKRIDTNVGTALFARSREELLRKGF